MSAPERFVERRRPRRGESSVIGALAAGGERRRDHRIEFCLDDPDRLAALATSGLMADGGEQVFDRYARIAARTLDCPAALITFVDATQECLKSASGIAATWRTGVTVSLENSFAARVVRAGALTVCGDTRTDPALAAHPAVTGFGARAFAGAPLFDGEHHPLGSLTVFDTRPRRWTGEGLAALADLASVITTEISLRHELRERIALARQLREAGRRDALTGLSNRQYFADIVESELLRSSRYDRDLGFVVVDIDYFRSLNDRHGRDAGDEALRAVARALSASVRSVDHVCRLGGEEFAILLPETPLEGAKVVAERVRSSIEQNPIRVGGESIPLTVSCGVAQAFPGESLDELTARTQSLVTAAQAMGHNRVEWGLESLLA